MVEIHEDSLRHSFTWPSRVPLRHAALELLGRRPADVNPKRLPDPEKHRERKLVKIAYKAYLEQSIDPRKRLIFTDVERIV